MEMIHTGVFATNEELAQLMTMNRQSWRHGDTMIVTSVLQGIIKDQKTVDTKKACHVLALHYGLPEIDGYYGMCEDSEFVNYK